MAQILIDRIQDLTDVTLTLTNGNGLVWSGSKFIMAPVARTDLANIFVLGQAVNGTLTTAPTGAPLSISVTYNQVGVNGAANTDCAINRTETSLGQNPGEQKFVSLAVNGTEKYSIHNTGMVTAAGGFRTNAYYFCVDSSSQVNFAYNKGIYWSSGYTGSNTDVSLLRSSVGVLQIGGGSRTTLGAIRCGAPDYSTSALAIDGVAYQSSPLVVVRQNANAGTALFLECRRSDGTSLASINKDGTITGSKFMGSGSGLIDLPLPDLSGYVTTTALTTGLAAKAPTVHSHGIVDVQNLQTVLDGKATGSHSHSIANVTGLQTSLNGKAAAIHQHTVGDVAGLQDQIDALTPDLSNYVTASDLAGGLNDKAARVTSPVDGNLMQMDDSGNCADAGTTVSALTGAIAGKAAASHSHATSDVTGLDTALGGKAASSHSHATSDVTNLDSVLAGKLANGDSGTLTDLTLTNNSGNATLTASSGTLVVDGAGCVEAAGGFFVDGNALPSMSAVISTAQSYAASAAGTKIAKIGSPTVGVLPAVDANGELSQTVIPSAQFIWDSNTTKNSTPASYTMNLANVSMVHVSCTWSGNGTLTLANPSGSPANGRKILFRVKNATSSSGALTIAWGNLFRGGTDVAVPTTLANAKSLYVGAVYNDTDSKWDVIAAVGGI